MRDRYAAHAAKQGTLGYTGWHHSGGYHSGSGFHPMSYSPFMRTVREVPVPVAVPVEVIGPSASQYSINPAGAPINTAGAVIGTITGVAVGAAATAAVRGGGVMGIVLAGGLGVLGFLIGRKA